MDDGACGVVDVAPACAFCKWMWILVLKPMQSILMVQAVCSDLCNHVGLEHAVVNTSHTPVGF